MKLNGSLMLPDNPRKSRQTKTPARKLGREERIEDSPNRLRVHSAAVVLNLRKHVIARRDRVRQIGIRQGLAGKRSDARPQADCAARIADRFRRVDDQVHHYLLNLTRVGQQQGQVLIEVEPKLHAVGNGTVDQSAGLNRHLGET